MLRQDAASSRHMIEIFAVGAAVLTDASPAGGPGLDSRFGVGLPLRRAASSQDHVSTEYALGCTPTQHLWSSGHDASLTR